MGEHRQVRQVVQAEADHAASAVGGAVEERRRDGEEGLAIGVVLPDGGLAATDAAFFRRETRVAGIGHGTSLVEG